MDEHAVSALTLYFWCCDYVGIQNVRVETAEQSEACTCRIGGDGVDGGQGGMAAR
jgi:hypothetical protein